MAFKLKNGTWRVIARCNGERVSRNFRTKALAEMFAEKVRRVRRGEEEIAPAQSLVTFGEFAERWFREYVAVEVSETTAYEYKSVFECHLKDAFQDIALTKLTKSHLLKLRADLKVTRKPKTVNNIVAVAKSILASAVEWHDEADPILPANPWASIPNLPLDEQPFDFWTVEERDKFLAAAKFRDPTFAELAIVALNTGLRMGELRALQCSALDFERRQICVAACYSAKMGKRYERTKTRRIGYVPMNDIVYKILYKRVLLEKEASVFEARLFPDALGRLERIAKAAGVKVIRFHDLRHTFASNLVMAGVDIFTVSKLLRHASVNQTMRYAHLAPQHLHQEVSRLLAGTDLAPYTGIATLRSKKH